MEFFFFFWKLCDSAIIEWETKKSNLSGINFDPSAREERSLCAVVAAAASVLRTDVPKMSLRDGCRQNKSPCHLQIYTQQRHCAQSNQVKRNLLGALIIGHCYSVLYP